MCCVMRDVWCARIFVVVRSSIFESRGDQNHSIWVVSGLMSDIPKLTPGGSPMYALSCNASYEHPENCAYTNPMPMKELLCDINMLILLVFFASFSVLIWRRNLFPSLTQTDRKCITLYLSSIPQMFIFLEVATQRWRKTYINVRGSYSAAQLNK